MKLTSPNVETVLDGYRLSSDQGSIAFCSVTLVEGLDEGGSLADPGGHGAYRTAAGPGRRPAPARPEPGQHRRRRLHPRALGSHREPGHLRAGRGGDAPGRAALRAAPASERFRLPGMDRRGRLPVRGPGPGRGGRHEAPPGVEIVAAPGHSAGTIAVAVATSDGIAVIAGDSIQNALGRGNGATRSCSGTTRWPRAPSTSCSRSVMSLPGPRPALPRGCRGPDGLSP